MGSLIPGQALIYERDGDTTYARYRDPPHNQIPRWVMGQGPVVKPTYKEWLEIRDLANDNDVIRKQLDKLMVIYYTIKEPEEKQ